MIVVKVTYAVKPDFVSQNRENIELFMKDFHKTDSKEFQYTVFLSEDGKTFTHLSMYKNEDIQKILLSIDSFKSFQQKRDNSDLEAAPAIEMLHLVASSFSL